MLTVNTLPIVKAAFKGKEYQIYISVMMIDTGSINCILNKSVLPYLDNNAAIEGKTMKTHSVQRKGDKFLRQNHIVLYYEAETLHTSVGRIEGNPEHYTFFFPMSYGLKLYNIPVVGLVYVDKDDGSYNDTVITKHVMDDAGICVRHLGNDGTT